MKSFKQFMNEADIKGNPAVSPEYLASLNKRAEASAQEIERKYGRDMGSLMRAVHQVQSIQRGKESQLEALTYEVIMQQYGTILGETELEIKIPTGPGQIKKVMKSDEEDQDQDTPTFKEIEDVDTKVAIHKRKILNMIAQGEAINSKKMLMSDLNMDGLTELFGADQAKTMVELLIKITDICNARDWRIPEEVGARMIEQGDAISGVSKIEWKPKTKEESEEEADEPSAEEETPSEETTVPKLIIMGLDQAMLFHEAVKAIYGLINQGGLAHLDDETIAKVFMNADTPRDEVQDLKRAKLTAADLRDFINTFPESNTIENFREYVWGKMIDASVLSDSDFLILMNTIFTAAPAYRTQLTGEAPYSEEELRAAQVAMGHAKADVSKLVDMIKRELADWEESMRAHAAGEYDDEDQFTRLGIERPSAESEEMDLDSILDKISKSGMDSLTPAELEFLKNQ